ncbi:MAG: endolytic transglycosylase MltG [Methylomonas sp.]|nr:endolytic transglycosylase MltG [Methylomonas sp.]PPD20577.1 MAG: aminodeoxychorismate lyase [Methylomonas sp.]PPD25645.1 MAG: aminodeoxychorismate lyase [Methylomonas sp.]PPD36632.1 MAG: aminodeoxychorismate lyase [Methylomonas sp.]PPD42822.1 MAG: aminodeoxychorismate lyase [Methylomonas sp.]
MSRSIIAFTTLMVAGLVLTWGWMHYHLVEEKPVVTDVMTLEVGKGDTLNTVITRLRQQNLAIDPFWFKLFAYHNHLDRVLKTGEYVLQPGFTAADILTALAQGKTRKYAITFPEGWGFKQMLQAIRDNPNLQHTLSENELEQFLADLGTDKTHPEGLFFPDTYYFEKHSTDVELLRRAHDRMQNLLISEWHRRDKDVPLENPYQALILASIIEKETAAAEERKKIAGVFVRRLKKGMLLQTDPTVIYGMGEQYRGNISRQDLREPTPYNTYVNKGLPPTPIALPGKAAIIAALHPSDGDALFFVSRGDGRHAFSATLKEHERYVDTYQR